MKVLFVQDQPTELQGIMYLSAMLKENGHDCDVLIEKDSNIIIDYIKRNKFDIVGFHCMTPSHNWLKQTIRDIKKKCDCMVMVGGPHPTYYPEAVMSDTETDLLCRGEGEYATLELIEKLETNESLKNVKNFWIRDFDKIYKNPPRDLLNDLDQLPLPDRSIYYDKYSYLKNMPLKRFIAGRGCLFNCSFCHNHLLRDFYSGKRGFVRKRTPQNLIQEIMKVKEKYPTEVINFSDDMFTYGKKWIKKFLYLYKKKINLPFVCNIHPNLVDEEIVKLLKYAGCHSVVFGIETGNEKIRKNVLNKNVSDERIISMSRTLKKHNINIYTYNMLGLPTESLEDAFETLEMNIKIGVDYTDCFMLKEFPKLDILDFFRHPSEKSRTPLEQIKKNTNRIYKHQNETQLRKLSMIFPLIVKFPFLRPMAEKLVNFPSEDILKYIKRIVWTYDLLRHCKLNPLSPSVIKLLRKAYIL